MSELRFEFDPNKSESNKVKHGINFVKAEVLWSDTQKIRIPAPTHNEPRFVVIGIIGGKHWSAVITYRGSKIRIISVRRSRKEEVKLYES